MSDNPSRSDGSPPTGDRLVVLAVDDERPALDELCYLLDGQDSIERVHAARDATTALRVLRAHSIDAVFLDINMPGLDGLELAGIFTEFAAPPAVVFVTAHDDRAVAAFDLGAVDYLLKPIRVARLTESVQRIVAQRSRTAQEPTRATENTESIPVELGGMTTIVPRSSIGWVEAEGDYTRLHTANGSHIVRIPISSLETRWADAGFVRVHRSYLVSLPLVTGIRSQGTGYVVVVRANGSSPEAQLPVSRRHVKQLKDRLIRDPMQKWSGR
ncbi:LytR/AlgR family response regulator transcription factor [Antrihabitans spumae]|uniref:LytR/AlgR family response regulator transcription factor n=1 Tax=Antrihabitans spumae TaxID=3373370 RepID=A0ABW7K6X4_9NOCA